MKLRRSKVWSVIDIGCLKWACIFFGMIVGAFLSEFTRRHVWLFAIGVILLAIKPIVSYFGNDQREHEKEEQRWQA
jgi:putative Mn2+ efflux pump MntP